MAMVPQTFSTPLTELFGIKHPIMLAGMNQAAGPQLAAAVTNCGGIGVIGGVGYTPKILKNMIQEIKDGLDDKNAPFGVDLLLPKVGGGARKTNKDYTGGTLPQLVDIIIESGAKLFVCAVGVPPVWCVQKFHDAGILVMNMIGAPKHAPKALAAGVDIICAQGGEGGGHTGDVPTSVLVPKVVDYCKGKMSPLTGKQVSVVAAGGIFDGRGLAMALNFGCDAVWVGTRFVAAKEAGAPPRHQQGVLTAGYHDTIRSIMYTGRPLRIKRDALNVQWEENRQKDIRELADKGQLAFPVASAEYLEGMDDRKKMLESIKLRPMLMGQCAGAIDSVEPAAKIMADMILGAQECIKRAHGLQTSRL